MPDRIDRSRKRKMARAGRDKSRHLQVVADPAVVSEMLNAPGDPQRPAELAADRSAFFDLNVSPEISDRDVQALLDDLQNLVKQSGVDNLVESARRSVLESIVGPLGLGGLLHQFDRDGGPVTTVHNARQGIYASNRDRERFEEPFDRDKYEAGFPAMRRRLLRDEADIVDAYTGRVLPKDGRFHLDHVISAKAIHSDDLLRLSTTPATRNKIATDPDNIVPTSSSLNQSKSDRDLKEWSDSKGKDGRTNAERYGAKSDLTDAVDKTSKAHYRYSKTKEVAKHFTVEIGREAAIGAAGMGVQQALGLALSELTNALFDEMRDVLCNGFHGGALDRGVLEILTERFKRVGHRVLARWKDVIEAFKNGALAGLLSTLVTTLINTFLTTSKRIVRMIREGGMSLLRALKLLTNPPAGMSTAAALHEASKILLAGTVLVGGLALEETVSTWTATLPFGDAIAVAVIGLATGLGTVLGVYALDQMDPFGAATAERDRNVAERLTLRFEKADAAIEDLLSSFEPVRLIE